MKRLSLVLIFLMVSIGAGPTYIQKFGSGWLTRKANSTVYTQKFGNGYLSRENFRGGKTVTRIVTPFGPGFQIRTQK